MSVQTRTTALQNEVVRLYFTFEKDGTLTNPTAQPLIEILDVDGVTVLDNVHASIDTTGIWFADWCVPANLPLGIYYDRWTYQWTSTSSVEESTMVFTVHSLDTYINSISPGITHNISSRVVQLMMDLTNEFIHEAMHIPIYWEQALRVQQENQQKRVESYYFLTLEGDPVVKAEAVYFNNGQKFTVFQDLEPDPVHSSSSSSSESLVSHSYSSSSSSSVDSSSSSSSSSSSNSSTSSESVGNVSSSSSSGPAQTTTTTTTEWSYKPILTVVGTGDPSITGVLTKISGTGPDTLVFTGWEKKVSRFSTVYNLAYQNWNMDPRPVVRLNNRIIDDGWFVDYNGMIYFDGIMSPEDSVNIRYNFAYFSEEEILSFLRLSLKMMNTVPPASVTYNSLINMPMEWDAPVLLFAAMTALRRLIFGLNWREKFVIFTRPDDPGATNQVIEHFKSLLQEYSTLWLEVKKDVKTRKLPGMAQYVTPNYTLPGGRSRFFRYMYKTNS